MSRRLLILGLDCLSPRLVFGRFALPNFRRLMQAGCYGELESTVPPITVPAWMSMVTGKDPGELGLYGFRNRKGGGYGWHIADSGDVQAPALWDLLGRKGKNVIVFGVPPSYPPRPVNGCLVSDFLTPGTSAAFTYPGSLREEILRLEPEYQFDVKDFRSDNKQDILRQIYRMTDQHFRVASHLLRTQPWDFFMMVEIGPDRLHHAFWDAMDVPDHPYCDAVRDYYVHLDGKLGEMLGTAGPETDVLIVSDHGAQAMEGGFAVNQWLIEKGYLSLSRAPGGALPLEKADVDWKRTRAWGAGGYYARLFINRAGREAEGTVPPSECESLRDELERELSRIQRPGGRALKTTVYRPEKIYKQTRGSAPDLLVYVEGLRWRSVGSVGHGSPFVAGNDTGPDGANHAPEGVFIHHGAGRAGSGYIGRKSIYDIFPLVCSLFEST